MRLTHIGDNIYVDEFGRKWSREPFMNTFIYEMIYNPNVD